MTNLRAVAATALASATFGCVIGAFAMAATQSQASSQAIAAAVQKVSDASADRSLKSIRQDLDPIARPSNLRLSSVLATMERQLYDICENTKPPPPSFTICQFPNLSAGKDARNR